jgi:hypothetical protein
MPLVMFVAALAVVAAVVVLNVIAVAAALSQAVETETTVMAAVADGMIVMTVEMTAVVILETVMKPNA